VKFSLIAPNGTRVIDGINGTLQGGANSDNWSSSNLSDTDIGTFTFTNTAPVINTNVTSPSGPVFNSQFIIIANVSDADSTPLDIYEVNFSLINPNGVRVIDNVNGTLQGGTNADNWSSISVEIDQSGTWT